MEKAVPGSAGWTITGDRSVEFAKSPLDFIERRISQYESPVFLARALNKPTVFVCSNNGVREILLEKEDCFSMGYKDFGYIHNLFGDVLLFYDDADAMRVRSAIGNLFEPKKCHCYVEQVDSLADDLLSNLDKSNSVQLYERFKSFATAVSLQLFLDLDWKDSRLEFETVKSISIMHWHGLISVPLNVRVRGWSSSFSKAIEAKEYLLNFIRKRLRKCSGDETSENFIGSAKAAGFKDEEEMVHHILVFVSALIPKALASILTSFCIATSGPDKDSLREKIRSNEELLDDVLLEVQRLWPPFLGGRRITKQDVVIDGYNIPSGTAVAFMTWFANRDVCVFHDPNSFDPSRWQNRDKEKRDLVWTFGGGKRVCVGYDLINRMLKIVLKKLVTNYDYHVTGSQSLAYKTLPVARPRETVHMTFSRRSAILR